MDVELHVVAEHPHAEILLHAVVLTQTQQHARMKAQVSLQADNCRANMHLVSFLVDQGSAEVDGSVTIAPNTMGCSGHLLEENIILGEKTRIKTLPMLDVRSSDVSASHGAKIQQLNPQHLFYLTAKGIPATEATRLMIE
ncbi:MAG: SufD family Fe-S cluster assembly protein [Candidatus Peribacteria bacterium]|nr:MAG: SufD family Fe-S cluster assembly protein [Candidatus Peribacteria bacterium]